MPINNSQTSRCLFLKNKIAELEQWLQDNSSEHEARPQINADLRNAKQEFEKLNEQLNERTFERDTFDISEQQIFKK